MATSRPLVLLLLLFVPLLVAPQAFAQEATRGGPEIYITGLNAWYRYCVGCDSAEGVNNETFMGKFISFYSPSPGDSPLLLSVNGAYTQLYPGGQTEEVKSQLQLTASLTNTPWKPATLFECAIEKHDLMPAFHDGKENTVYMQDKSAAGMYSLRKFDLSSSTIGAPILFLYPSLPDRGLRATSGLAVYNERAFFTMSFRIYSCAVDATSLAASNYFGNDRCIGSEFYRPTRNKTVVTHVAAGLPDESPPRLYWIECNYENKSYSAFSVMRSPYGLSAGSELVANFSMGKHVGKGGCLNFQGFTVVTPDTFYISCHPDSCPDQTFIVKANEAKPMPIKGIPIEQKKITDQPILNAYGATLSGAATCNCPGHSSLPTGGSSLSTGGSSLSTGGSSLSTGGSSLSTGGILSVTAKLNAFRSTEASGATGLVPASELLLAVLAICIRRVL